MCLTTGGTIAECLETLRTTDGWRLGIWYPPVPCDSPHIAVTSAPPKRHGLPRPNGRRASAGRGAPAGEGRQGAEAAGVSTVLKGDCAAGDLGGGVGPNHHPGRWSPPAETEAKLGVGGKMGRSAVRPAKWAGRSTRLRPVHPGMPMGTLPPASWQPPQNMHKNRYKNMNITIQHNPLLSDCALSINRRLPVTLGPGRGPKGAMSPPPFV